MINLESYLIPVEERWAEEESLRTEPAIPMITVNFFGKQWNGVKIRNNGLTSIEANKRIRPFLQKSSKISKEIESKFCELCNKYNDDPGYTGIPAGSIKKYSDVKGLSLKEIVLVKEPKTNNYLIKLCGEYDIDDEHGWSMNFKNCEWTGHLGQYMDYE